MHNQKWHGNNRTLLAIKHYYLFHAFTQCLPYAHSSIDVKWIPKQVFSYFSSTWLLWLYQILLRIRYYYNGFNPLICLNISASMLRGMDLVLWSVLLGTELAECFIRNQLYITSVSNSFNICLYKLLCDCGCIHASFLLRINAFLLDKNCSWEEEQILLKLRFVSNNKPRLQTLCLGLGSYAVSSS
jgi:hypothetical protein